MDDMKRRLYNIRARGFTREDAAREVGTSPKEFDRLLMIHGICWKCRPLRKRKGSQTSQERCDGEPTPMSTRQESNQRS